VDSSSKEEVDLLSTKELKEEEEVELVEVDISFKEEEGNI